MKRNNLLAALFLTSAGLGLALACGGGSKSDPAPRPNAPQAPRNDTPRPSNAAPQMLVEPRSATVVTGGNLQFTSFGVREGATVTLIDRIDGSQNFGSRVEETGGGTVPLAFRSGTGLDVRYLAPATPGIYHVRFAGGPNHAAVRRIPLTVEHAPVGRTAILEQRAVTVTAGRDVVFTVREAPTPGVTRTFRLQVQETGGGSMVASSRSGNLTHVYRAPATPGTYHVVLSSPEDAAIADTAAVTVVAE